MIDMDKTNRGFGRGSFIDRYGEKCSIQDSSLATEECIWLGVDSNRMHLTVEMAQELIVVLQRFVETGSVGEE